MSLLTACAKIPYIAQPIDSAQVSDKLMRKDATSTDFNSYLIKQGYSQHALPFISWGVNELTLCALYYHSKLDVAKAQLALANANLENAHTKQNPTLSGNLARSNQANGDLRPWAYGLNVEIPIETGYKRDIRIEEAQHLVAVARIDVAATAWQLRSQIAQDFLRYHAHLAQLQLLTQEQQQQNARIQLLEKRVQLGMLSNTDLNATKLQQQKALHALQAEQAKTNELNAILAADVGLSNEKFKQLTLKPFDIETTLTQQTAQLTPLNATKLQENALLNRLDIRRSLQKYAAAEANIKLEVAKQTPDISLSPGFAFEFGDSVWSLGFSALLNLINQNPTLINQATQLRALEGAQFEALQASIIADVEQALARYQASLHSLMQAKQQQTTQLAYSQKIQRQFDAGLIDKLELTQNQLNNSLLAQQVLLAQFNSLNAALALEALMQRPIFDDTLPITLPTNSSVGMPHE